MSRTSILVFGIIAAQAVPLFGRSAGAPNGYSGAPGEGNCTACHRGVVNSGPGRVSIAFAAASYMPGQSVHVTVTIADPNAKRWGFEASPRIASGSGATGAGALNPSDGNSQVRAGDNGVQWITHTAAGTRAGTANSAAFEFDWAAPASDAGDIEFYVAANAANNDGTNGGDSIYTAKATLFSASVSRVKPSIAPNGVVNGASFKAGIAAGSWITIQGSNLSASARTWDSARDFQEDRLPQSLDGTSVTVNGKPAAVYYISPGQINVQAPSDDSLGPVNVVVKTMGGSSDPVQATLQRFAPGLFLFDQQNRRYAAAVAADGTLLGPAGLIGTNVTTRPAKPGETILLFGTGFGPTDPAVPAGRIFNGAAKLASNDLAVTIGGIPAQVAFAGLTSAGLYQFNVVVPPSVGDGDRAVVLSIGGTQTQDGAMLAIQN